MKLVNYSKPKNWIINKRFPYTPDPNLWKWPRQMMTQIILTRLSEWPFWYFLWADISIASIINRSKWKIKKTYSLNNNFIFVNNSFEIFFGWWTFSRFRELRYPIIQIAFRILRLHSGIFSKFHMHESFQKLICWICREFKMMKNDTYTTCKL